MATRTETLERIRSLGLLAVLRGPSPELTLKMVSALVEGGVLGIEITFTTPQALKVVESLTDEYGSEIVLGMGTLTRPEQAGEAKSAGASFLVSPHTESDLAKAMGDTGLPVMMGAFTPSEVMRAWSLKSDVIKIFPGSLGGPSHLKALKGPFPEIPMMPTGGVDESNLADWFKAGAFAVGAGSNLCPKGLAEAGEFDRLVAIARTFVDAVRRAKAPD